MNNKEYNIFDIISMAMRRWWIIALCMIIGGSALYLVSYYLSKPVYKSVGTLYVSNINKSTAPTNSDDISLNEIVTSQELLKSAVEVLSTEKFYTRVKEVSKVRYTPSAIKGMVSMSSKNETEVLEISVNSSSPYDSYVILETIIALSKEEIELVIEGGTIKVLDHAKFASNYLPRNIGRNSLLGAIAGIIAAIGIIIIIEMFDTRIKSSKDLVDTYEFYILGEIPSIE
ncbi:MAG: hypothetical protein E7404_07905 [Ruminococcaceae bacterium]|nr:hypothetical protein [Oscillospiraceae bacterium]